MGAWGHALRKFLNVVHSETKNASAQVPCSVIARLIKLIGQLTALIEYLTVLLEYIDLLILFAQVANFCMDPVTTILGLLVCSHIMQ